MSYKIRKNFTDFPSEFYVNVVWFHLKEPASCLCEDFDELPLVLEDLP